MFTKPEAFSTVATRGFILPMILPINFIAALFLSSSFPAIVLQKLVTTNEVGFGHLLVGGKWLTRVTEVYEVHH
jgi:hypothetical protein